MPRINRDLDRRLAARRERERRRSAGTPRYRFGPSAPDEIEPTAQEAEEQTPAQNGAARPRSAPRPEPVSRSRVRSFAEYRQDYAYVGVDLRRVALVVAILLVLLLVLWLVLPR